MHNIESQLCDGEKSILRERVSHFGKPTILEVGTYKGGGSTLTFLEALRSGGGGKLYGVEADSSVFAEMKANIESVDPSYFAFFEPIQGFSQAVIPGLLKHVSAFELAFLDGGNNPQEQIDEFRLLADAIPVGGFLFSHDANLRKGKWLVPYLSELDNWRVDIHHESEEGLLEAEKIGLHPSSASLSRANRALKQMMRSPIEIATRFFPSSFKGAVLRMLPFRIRRRLGEGRK